MKPFARFGLAFALVGAIGACSGDSTGPTYDETVDAGDALGVAESSYLLLHDLMDAVGSAGGVAAPMVTRIREAIAQGIAPVALPAGMGLAGWRPIDQGRVPRPEPTAGGIALVAPGCTTSESGMDAGGDPIDANGNGVPDDYQSTVRCEVTETLGGDSVVTTHVVYEVRVRERTGDLFGYDLLVHQLQQFRSNFGFHQDMETRQEEGISFRSDRVGVKVLNSLALSVQPIGDSVVHTAEQLERMAMTYAPEDPIGLESELPDGEVTLDGEVRYVNTDIPIAVRFLLDTPEPLQYSAACVISDDQAFVGGIMRGRFDGRSSVGFTLDFDVCGEELTYDTFGIEEEAPGAPRFRP